MYAVFQIFVAAALVTSCFNLPVKSSGTTTVLNSEARPATAKALTEEKSVSAYDPNSKVETTIQPPSGALAGSKITMPAGALALAVDLIVEESVPLSETSVASSLKLREDIKIQPVGAGLIVRPSANVDLTKPLTIAMSLEAIGGLRSWLQGQGLLAADKHYAVFYKSMIKGELRAGVIPTSELRFSEDNQVLFEGYFGAFWLCEVSSPVEQRVEVETNEPTVNANYVSVIESTGIVTEEAIAAKAAIPELVWSTVSLSFNSDLRIAQVKSSLVSGPSLASCQVDLRTPNDSSADINWDASINLSLTFPVTKKGSHTLIARYRCLDTHGRLTVSAWSASLSIPAEPDPALAMSVVINEGALYTKSSQVSLTLAASGAAAMYITESVDCGAGGSWETYAPSKALVLTATNTEATVYAKFKNSLGKESSCIKSSIIHDDQAPLASKISINSDAAATSSTAVTLTFTVAGANEMYLTNSSGCSSNGSWETLAASKAWTLAETNATVTVYGKFRDAAGNETSCLSASIVQNTTDTMPPSIPSIPSIPINPDSTPPWATAISINSGASSTSSSAATLTLTASEASEMYVTNIAGCASDGSWEPYATSKVWTLAPSSSSALVYVKYRDSALNESTCISDSISYFPSQVAPNLTVAGGSDFTCALLSGGLVKCWGGNGVGQLGQGHSNSIGYAPGQMENNLPPINLGSGLTAVALATGEQHACAILDNGSVKCWGYNGYGSLGIGNNQNKGTAAADMGDNLLAVDLGLNRTAKQIAAAYYHTCVVMDNGSVKCWGLNAWGQLGLGDGVNRGDAPGQMGDLLPAVSLGLGRTAKFVTTGFYFSCALLDNDTVKCWGYNGEGMLGRGDTAQIGDEANEMGDSLLPVDLGPGRTVKAVRAGERFVCAILDTDALKCWGYNALGALGTGNPNQIGDGLDVFGNSEMGANLLSTDLGANLYAVKLAASIQTCAILNNGSVKCWGMNGSGQLGQGDSLTRGSGVNQMGDALSPINLGTGRTALAIGTGNYHTCAILDDKSIKCWGYNNAGQLGQGHISEIGVQGGQMGDNLPAIPLEALPMSGLKLWLRADSNLYQNASGTIPAAASGDPIGLWKDRSGNSGDMTVPASLDQTIGRPVLNSSALNGQPALTFNGASSLNNLVNYPYPNTIFVLGRYTGGMDRRILSGSSNNWLMGWFDGASSPFYADAWINYPASPAGTTWYAYATDQTATAQRIFQGNNLMATGALTNSPGPIGLSVGGWSTCCVELSAAEVAEVIVYDRMLTDAERASVYAYLNARYALGP